MNAKSVDRFESGLDIRNLIRTALEFKIQQNVLFSEKQRYLLRRNRRRIVTLSSQSESEDLMPETERDLHRLLNF